MKHALVLLLLVLIAPALRAQSADAEVTKYLAMVQDGKMDQVKAEIPSLLSKYPNNPGVLYLQAQTTSEGAEAVRIYQSIVDNFPASEWASEALFRVYQFYYALGLYRTAEMKMAQLKKNYPASKRATGGERLIPASSPKTGSNPLLRGHPQPRTRTPRRRPGLRCRWEPIRRRRMRKSRRPSLKGWDMRWR